jgi:hypothetical protein
MRHHKRTITPEQAARWLARIEMIEHHELRPIDQRLVDHFTKQLKRKRGDAEEESEADEE